MRALLLAALVCAGTLLNSADAGTYTLRIVAPKEDATVHENSGKVTVSLRLSPALNTQAGDRIVLLLDGKIAAGGGAKRSALEGVDRGTHTLEAQVVGSDGAVLAASPPVVFHMWRASRLSPSRKN